MKVIVRPQFYTDVSEEVEWLLENAGAEVAKRWRDALWQTVQFLKTHPKIGRERQDLNRSGVRSWRVNHFTRWLIFYGVREGTLIVYRVRSGTMNLVVLELES